MSKKLFYSLLILSLIAQASIGLFAFPNQVRAVGGRIYYVSVADGNDTYDGLETTHGSASTGPFKTIAHINAMTCGAGANQLAPGDSVLFKNGETWREQLTVTCSGSVGSVITFGSYVGADNSAVKPVISGANPITSWTQGTGTLPEETCTGPCIFDSGMETGGSTFTDWTSTEVYHATIDQSTAFVAHGAHSMAMTKTAGSGDKAYLHKTITAPTAGVPMYFRFYMYVPSGALAANLVNQIIWDNELFSPNLAISTDSSGNVSAMQWYAGGCAPCSTGVNFTSDAWHSVEIEFLVGTTANNGGGELWLDGVSIGSGFTYDTRAKTFTEMQLGFQYGATIFASVGKSAYIDDYRQSTTGPIGPFSAGGVPTNVWYSTVTTQPNVVAVNGVVSQAQSGYGSLSAGQWYWANNTLYVGSVTSPTDVQAGTRDYSLTFPYTSSINYVTVDGITFQYANLNNVYITNGDHITIQNCTITGAYQHGIWAFGYASPPETLTYFTADRNTVSYNGASGIMINSKHTHATVTHNIVHHNAYNTSNTAPFFQYMAGIYFFDNQSTPNYDLAAYNISYNNGVFGGNANQGTGIWMDTVYNSTEEYNIVHDNAATGIFLEASVNSAMIYNVSYGNATNQYTAGMASYATTFSASGNTIANNTVWGSHWWGLQLGVYTGASVTWSNNIIKNNIVVGSNSTDGYFDHAALNDSPYGSGNVYSNNAFGPEAATFWMLSTAYGSPWVTSYAQFNTFYGSDAHSVQTDPQFTNGSGSYSTSSDFTLLSSSPAIDTGTTTPYNLGLSPSSVWPSSVTTLDQTTHGAGWDIGAYVYTQSTVPTVSLTAPSAGTVFGTSTTVSATASATAPAAVSQVQFYLDSTTSLGIDTTSPYSIIWDTTSASNASHTLLAVATDNYGNVATSSPAVTVTVDNAAPARSGGSPSGQLSSNTTSATLAVTTDKTATCKYSGSAGTTFGSMAAFSSTNSTAHTTSVSNLSSSQSYTYYVKCQDGLGNTNSDDYAISFSVQAQAGGGGLPSVAYMAPQVPAGGFKVVIDNGAAATSDRKVNLTLTAGTDVKNMAISNTGDFSDAGQQAFVSSLAWDLCSAQNGYIVYPNCAAGNKTISVKFFTSWGQPSAVVQASINYQPSGSGGKNNPVNPPAPANVPTNLNFGTPTLNNVTSSSCNVAANPFQFYKTLVYGNRGVQITYLQNRLKVLGLFPCDTKSNGIFGPSTLKAVQNFQIQYGIVKKNQSGYGQVGPKTRQVLNSLNH